MISAHLVEVYGDGKTKVWEYEIETQDMVLVGDSLRMYLYKPHYLLHTVFNIYIHVQWKMVFYKVSTVSWKTEEKENITTDTKKDKVKKTCLIQEQDHQG